MSRRTQSDKCCRVQALDRLRRFAIGFSITFALCGNSFFSAQQTVNWKGRAAQSAQVLANRFDPGTGLWNDAGWWKSANALDSLIRYMFATGDWRYQDVVEASFSRISKGGFLNNYYDDEGWWALTWLDAYRMAHDPRYLHAASLIFADMALSWDGKCGGGIWWSKERKYKNAIANELFLSVALGLQQATADRAASTEYRDWALKEWSWLSKSGMIAGNSLVNDGLDDLCHNNGGQTWSYNQGVILGALLELRNTTGNERLVEIANNIAGAAIHRLADNAGVLHEPCEPNCGKDGREFKGIFVKNLSELYSETLRAEYRNTLLLNAQSLWLHDRDSRGRFGLNWSGSSDVPDSSSQNVGVDLLNAAATATCEPARVAESTGGDL